MEKWMKRTVRFAAELALASEPDPSVIPFVPTKTEIPGNDGKYFPRTTPESRGISSGRLIAFIDALEGAKELNIHSLLVVKDGCAVLECSHPGYSARVPHLSHSMSKVLTSLAIGLLVDDGVLSLDARVVELFPEYTVRDPRMSELTVEHLLTMTSGARFGEAGVVSETDWLGAFFESGSSFAPGERFEYNSMNSYVLACIAARLSGRSLSELLRERILEPLGIRELFWERARSGVEKGGFGAYMSAEGWARIGQLVLNGGKLDGHRLISREYLVAATSARVQTPPGCGSFDYGYQIWASRSSDSILFSGMLGQCVYISPRNGLVVSVNSGNNELFQARGLVPLIERMLGGDLSSDLSRSHYEGSAEQLAGRAESFFRSRHWIRPYRRVRGFREPCGFIGRAPYPVEWDSVVASYDLPANNLGVLPIFVRAMQGSFGGGIDRMSVLRSGERLFLELHERGGPYRMEIGFTDFAETVLNIRGELYTVRVMGEALEDIDREAVFKLELVFPELPNSLHVLLRPRSPSRLDITVTELPGAGLADAFLSEVLASDRRIAFLVDMLNGKMGQGFVAARAEELFRRELIAARVGSRDYARVMEEGRREGRSRARSRAVIDAIVNTFLAEDEGDESRLRELVGSALARLRRGLGQSEIKKD